MSDNIPTVSIIRTEEHDCFILKIDETIYWLIDSGTARFPSYQYTKSAILKRKITNFKGIIITNPRKKHLDGMIRFFKECFSSEGVHANEFPNLDFHVIRTDEFRNTPIIEILRDNGFEFNNKESKFKYPNITMEPFFHENAMPLILKHSKDVIQDVNTVSNRDNMSIARNNAKIQTDMSSILTYLKYEFNGIKKSLFLTSDNIASRIQSVLTTKLNVYQQSQLNKRPFIDIFQVPRHGSRFNSAITHYVDPPKYVDQQFALMIILYCGEQFDFTDLKNETATDIKAEFESMLNFTNFEKFKKAALLQGYIQFYSSPNAIKRFLKAMGKALIMQQCSKNNNVDWDWCKIDWPKVARKLYIIYKLNQSTESSCWPKYDFIKDVVDIPKKDNLNQYFINTKRGNIIEKQLHSYFNRIKERIYENFDNIISPIKHNKEMKRRLQYATPLRPLLKPMWGSLNTSPLVFRYITSSISNFYGSFRAGTYIISSGSKKDHPDPLVIVGIIKSILEDSCEKRCVRILLTSWSKINMYLLVSTINAFLKHESNDIYKLLNQRIKIYTISESSCEVCVKLSNGEFEDPKSVRLLDWNCSEEKEIKNISDSFGTIPEQPINKTLWLGVNKKGDLVPSDKRFVFTISNVPFQDQIAYQISTCNFNFIVKFEWAAKDEYSMFYLVDLNTEQDLYYALEYDDDFCIVKKSKIGEFEESTPIPHFKKLPTKEGALSFNFEKDSSDDLTNQLIERKKSGKTLRSFLKVKELGERSALTDLKIINAVNYLLRACNVKKIFESFSDECLFLLLAKLDSEVEWEITKNNLFNIKNAIIKLDETELQKLRSSSPFYKYATDMQVNIKNPQLDNLQIEIKINLNNNGSKSYWRWTPEISDISQTKSVYDFLLNSNVPQEKWKDLTLSYLSLLIMPQLIVVPEFLKVPLPFLSGTSILNQTINKEISNIKFDIGPTGARLIQTEIFLDSSTTENKLQLDGIEISQFDDIKITIINSDAVNDDPDITIEACANIKDNIVTIITQNKDEQFLIAKFNKSTTLVNIAKSLNLDEKIYNKFKVPLYDILLDEFLKNIKPEFSLFFYPITEPPTMNFKLKNINILTNNSHQIKNFLPPQIYQHLKLTNISTDISIYDPLDIENIMIEQPMSISIKPQDLHNNNPLKLKEMLKAIGLYDTFKKIKEVSPILWRHVKNLESAKFQYLNLQIKLNEQSTTYEIDDFNLCILIPRFIIKERVIEVTNAIVDLEYSGTQWSGNIQGVAGLIGKDRNYICQIEYMSPTKEQPGNLLIKDFADLLTLKETFQILQHESVFTIPFFGKLFEPMSISEININLVNSESLDFIIEKLSFTLQADKLELKPLTIKQMEIDLTYYPSKNSTDSAIWKFNIDGNVDTMIITLECANEDRKIQATLTPIKSKRLKDITELLIKTSEFSNNSIYYEICDSEITNVKLTFEITANGVHMEKFSTNLYILNAIISRNIANHKIKTNIKINFSENSGNIVDATITSFQNHSLLELLNLLIGYNSTIQNLLPKLPNLTNFENIKPIQQKFSIKISINPFKIIGFNISAQRDVNYEILEKPSIFLQPLGISISYIYDFDKKEEKLEGKFYGTFILDDTTNLKLEFTSSATKDNNIVVASIQIIEGESSIHVSSVIDTLLNDNNGWSSNAPEEMRLLKFIVSTEVKAYLHINLVEKSVALYATLKSIGNCLLLIKKLNDKSSNDLIESNSIVKESGYLFSVKINGLKFEKLFKSYIVFIIDETLPLTRGNLMLVSYEGATFDKTKKELNDIINDLNDILNDDVKFEDIISIKLPDSDDQKLVQGANLYANLNYSNSNSGLLRNLCSISNLGSSSQEILVALSLGLGALSKSEFKAKIENLILNGGLSFEKISFSYRPIMKKPICMQSIKGNIGFNSENLNKKTILVGNILFVDRTPHVCSININQKIQIIHLLSTIFSKNFIFPENFPDITFDDGEIYYAFIQEDKIEIDKVYYKGYNIKAHIDFFGMENLSITAQIHNGIKIKVTEDDNSVINLGFVKIFKTNLIIEWNIKKHSISINGNLKLFDMNPVKFQLNYKKKTKCLEGEIKMEGSLFGVENPTIKGYLSKKNKFVITELPSICDWFWNKVEFAKIIEEASINLCKKIVSDLKLNENFQGHFNFYLEQHETQDDTLVSFLITGDYSIKITGEKKESTEIANIEFPSIPLNISYSSDIPKFLKNFFEKELPQSAVSFLKNLLKDHEKFVKFIDGLAIATLIELSELALNGFICLAGKELNKLTKDAFDAMKKCANNILRKHQPTENKPLEEDIKAVERASTLSNAVVLASSPFLITEEWFVYFVFAITLITVDLKILYSNQSDKETKIREEESEIKKINKRIKDATIPKNAVNDKLAREIRYKLHIGIIFGTELVEKDIIVGKKEIERDNQDHKRLSYHENQNYSGSQSKEGEIENKPKLYPPTELNSAYDSHSKILATKIISKDNDTRQYYCELINNKNVTIHTEENSIPGPGGEYKIRVLAKATNYRDSELKYADEVISRLPPPKYLEFKHIYDIAKEDSNWMDSSYTVSIKSFKFLSRINNIKESYNIDNNVLKITWDSVENASQYEVFLLAFGHHLDFNKTSENFIEYDMQKFDEQIRNFHYQMATYTCKIQAVNGRGFFDGPVTHDDKGFTQLPRPRHVDMEKISNNLHVSYSPITLPDNLKKDFKEYKIYLCNLQQSNERIVAESPLINGITSSYYDFAFEDIKFEENVNYFAKVYAISSNNQTISSFSGNSTKTMKRLLPPKNVQISIMINESDTQILASCAFDSKIKVYILGVINIKTKCSKKIHDSSERAEFHAFAQSIGNKNEFDSIIIKSDSAVTQFAAPKNILLTHKKNNFSVTYYAPTKGFYQAQIVDYDNHDNIFGGAKNKTPKGKDEIIVEISNLNKGMKYVARVRKVVYREDPTKFINSIWQFSNVITI
ncbi:31142_t:CDS:10 [Gigaspora margarita]|uniref:31142_t:CDS:1 n=1 Tax=Gigaspora margarita TaxID=4874 RepID=A0ABM8W521_GIGMA|nr:31142_t:CDS:10 [Gigaspora margarita]